MTPLWFWEIPNAYLWILPPYDQWSQTGFKKTTWWRDRLFRNHYVGHPW